MDVEEVEIEEVTDDKTFIHRLLGEMKNQFNKTEKKENSDLQNYNTNDEEILGEEEEEGTSNFSTDSPQYVETNNETAFKVPNIKNEVDSSSSPENNINSVATCNIKNEFECSDTVLANNIAKIKEEMNNQEDAEDKPRIVLTFRKPTPKKNDSTSTTKKRPLRAKLQILDEKLVVKRSSRRRSRDCNESVLQSAIARKEKSYNEASKPQRLTKQLKATPKILENLANAALKLDKTRDKVKPSRLSDKHKAIEKDSEDSEENQQSEMELENEKNHKRHKHRHKVLKHTNSKKMKNNHTEINKNSESDEDLKEDTKVKCVRNKSSLDDKLCRRSNRISSRSREDDINVEDVEELLEPSTADQDSFYPAEPECSSVEAQLIASQLCLCTHKTQIYVTANDDEVIFCTAIDSIGDRLVGCSNIIDGNEVAMLRPSTRVPYIMLCEVHLNRMLRHNCCPKCGLFCTQGKFAQCEAKHQYHRECQITVGDSQCCPHCGIATPTYDIVIKMGSSKKPVFLPSQSVFRKAAKMSFCKLKNNKSEEMETKRISPILSPKSILITVNPDSEPLDKYDVDILRQSIVDNDNEKLAVILGSQKFSLSTPIEELGGATVLHYASQNGALSSVHLLVIAGAELDVFDKEQNTALVCAILALQNDIVKYLIKAGASITLKGTDGMTALHLAAKCGNLKACELLVEASLGVVNYVNMADDGGWTPLVWSCEHNHFEITKFLLFKSADPLLRDVEHNIALHWAAFSGNADIAEILLNNKSDVNASNAHGDTPLHIAARQDMYNCILILLTRGADVNLVNKSGESPLHCTRLEGDCYNAILLNVQLQGLTSYDKSFRIILTNDISLGREANPIQCINMIDDDSRPVDFMYVISNCITMDDINIDYKVTNMHCCTCEGKCLTHSCLCCNNSLRCWYDEEGRLLANFNYEDPPMIFECNQLCSCNAITCNNRVVQHGLTQRFQLFKSESKGWSIRTLRNISKGTFICEYIGEIISDLEADRRVDDSYLFGLDNRISTTTKVDTFCIDAKHYGNFARFINHSCEPNLVPIRVFIEHQDLRFPRIALFANRDISSEEELSFDYGEKFWIIKYKSFTCDCGSSKCKYSEETIAATVEKYNKRLQEEGESTAI